jgi:hypothetical protein
MAHESASQIGLSGEIEEHDEVRCSIPGLRFIRATSVPRWAVEEPEEGVEQDDEQFAEEVPVAPAPREQDVPRIIPYHRYFDAVVGRLDDEGSPEEGEVDSTSLRNVTESTYNEQGLLTLREEFESDTLVLRKRFAYSPDGKLLRKVVEDPVSDTLETEERTYGANDRIARKVITYSDGSRLTTEHHWNGDRDEEFTSSEEGIESHVIRTYDSKDRLIERVEIDPQTKDTRRVLNTYNAQDQFVESRVIEPDGSRWVSARTEYDADGNEKSIVALDANGNEIQRTMCAYEGGDRIQEVTTEADGETHTENVFDDAHHCIRSTRTGIGVAKDYIFEYNERGLQTAFVFRSMEDRGLGRLGRIETRVRTTWLEYEFYSSAEATSIETTG